MGKPSTKERQFSTRETDGSKSRISIDSVLKTLEDSSAKGKDKSLLVKYMQAKRDLSSLSLLNGNTGKENRRPVSSINEKPKRASRSVSMASYPLQGKVKADQLCDRVMASKPMQFQSYLASDASNKRVIRSQSIGEYLQKKLCEPWAATRRK